MKRIIVGYDGSREARRALDRAAELADGGPVTVVSVAPVQIGTFGPGLGDLAEIEEHRRQLEHASTYFAEQGVRSCAREGRGDPARVLSAQARESNADLIIVARRNKSALDRLINGSASTALIHQAPCDVLVVRGAKGEGS